MIEGQPFSRPGVVIVEEMLPLLEMVRAARGELLTGDGDGATRCAKLLGLAEEFAGDLSWRVVDDAGALQAVTAVRTELGTCLIAADQLIDAGVAAGVVADVLRRGTMLAEQALSLAVLGSEAVGATP
jgi:hypothetical protein